MKARIALVDTFPEINLASLAFVFVSRQSFGTLSLILVCPIPINMQRQPPVNESRPASQVTSKSSCDDTSTFTIAASRPHVLCPLYAWQLDVSHTPIKSPPWPDISAPLHDSRPSSPSSQIMTSSAPTCTFRSHTVTPSLLTGISIAKGHLADPPDTRSEV